MFGNPLCQIGQIAALITRDVTKMLARMERETWDLLVIGGGISGAGIAREAAWRGLKVAM